MLITAPLWIAPAASGDCAGPSIELRPKTAHAGDEVVVRGDSWGDACNDTGVGIGPCSFSEPTLGEPQENIHLFLVERGGLRLALGEVDATESYDFETEVTIPTVAPGDYRLVARTSETTKGVDIHILPKTG